MAMRRASTVCVLMVSYCVLKATSALHYIQWYGPWQQQQQLMSHKRWQLLDSHCPGMCSVSRICGKTDDYPFLQRITARGASITADPPERHDVLFFLIRGGLKP